MATPQTFFLFRPVGQHLQTRSILQKRSHSFHFLAFGEGNYLVKGEGRKEWWEEGGGGRGGGVVGEEV